MGIHIWWLIGGYWSVQMPTSKLKSYNVGLTPRITLKTMWYYWRHLRCTRKVEFCYVNELSWNYTVSCK